MNIQKVIAIGILTLLFFMIIALLAFIIIFPDHKSHGVLLEYLKVVLSWPGVVILLSPIAIYVFILIHHKEPEIKYVETPKPNVTGFITVVGHTEDGNLIIKSNENEEIQDGDVVVNKAFILSFYDTKVDIKKLRLELKRFQEKLLEK